MKCLQCDPIFFGRGWEIMLILGAAIFAMDKVVGKFKITPGQT